MNKEIAIAFSTGQFKENYKYLADDIEWNIFGENLLQGKDSVIKHCNQVTDYFRSLSTDFETYHIIESSDHIAISGKAKFRKEKNKVTVINSCDIYEFNKLGQIQNIQSYCIRESQ